MVRDRGRGILGQGERLSGRSELGIAPERVVTEQPVVEGRSTDVHV
jgi:hypothetical protein